MNLNAPKRVGNNLNPEVHPEKGLKYRMLNVRTKLMKGGKKPKRTLPPHAPSAYILFCKENRPLIQLVCRNP